MDQEVFTLKLDGEEAADLYPDIVQMEVEVDEELAAMFRLTLAMGWNADGTWAYVDDERLKPWKAFSLEAGVGGGSEALIAGYITHVKPSFDPDPNRCALEVWGMDATALMDREEKLKDWPDKKDSDIAAEIFGLYGLTPQTEDSGAAHAEAVSTIIQRETDIQFLRRLALRNGFECYVEGGNGYFRPPQLDGPPQPVLAVQFGDDTNVRHFALEVNALAPANVSMYQLDRTEKQVLDATADASRNKAQGKADAASLPASGASPGVAVVGGVVATGQAGMAALCQGFYEQGSWFVTGEGEVAANDYGHVLKARQTVTIKGVGETHSGEYYVTHVTHSFTADGYTQRFRVKRNALLPSGSEDFANGGGGLF